ncbi:MAG: ATP synthase subunit I [Candidatus Aminicenantes bacterium]|jgi:hypothetical protein
MIETILIAIGDFFTGVGVGTFYFLGRWVTIKNLPKVRYPNAVSLLNTIFSTAVIFLLLYLMIKDGFYGRLIPFTLGYIVIWVVMVRYLKIREKVLKKEKN